MDNKIFISTFLCILFLCSSMGLATAQNGKLPQALELFENKDYKEAELMFHSLIAADPGSLDLYYYYGACRAENGNYSEYDLIQLLNADAAKAPIKLNYYLGIQYQAQENWKQALKYFNKFRAGCTAGEQEGLGIAEKIQECYDKENPYKGNVKHVTESSLRETTVSVDIADTLGQKGKPVTLPAETAIEGPGHKEEKAGTLTKKQDGSPIEFIVNSRIAYYNTKHFRTKEGKAFFGQSRSKQGQLDSILAKTSELREKYTKTDNSEEKASLGEKILTLETESYPLKEEVNNLLLLAQNKEQVYWANAPIGEFEKFPEEVQEEVREKEAASELARQTQPATAPSQISPEILLSEDSNDILLEEPEEKDELIYRIQIGAYSRGLPAYVERLYKNLSILRKIDNYTDEKGVVVYTTGELTNIEDAIKMQKQVRQEGAEDAFVVPYFNGKRITLGEAKKIESGQ